MISRTLLLLLLAGSHTVPAAAATPGPMSPHAPEIPGLGLEILLEKPRYEQGEPVRARLRFTYSGPQPLQIGTRVLSVSGRIDRVSFRCVDGAGKTVRDPFAGESIAFTRAPEQTLHDLDPTQPCDLPVVLNDWLALAEPGRYSIVAETAIVDVPEAWEFFRSFDQHARVTSPPIELTISPCPDAHRVATLKRAESDLANTHADRRAPTLRELGYLLDPRAIPLLVRGLEDPDFRNRRSAYASLVALPDLRLVQRVLLDKLDRDGPHLLPAAKSGYAQLLTAAEAPERGPAATRRIINGTTEKWSNYVGEKMAGGVENLSAAEAAERLYRMDAFGGKWDAITPGQKRRVLEYANTVFDAQWYHGAPQKPDEISSYWLACFIDYRCKIPALIPNLRDLTTNEKVSPQIRMAAYKVLGEMNSEAIPPIAARTSPRSAVWAMTPGPPSVQRQEDSWEVRFSSFSGENLELGANVIPGVECEEIISWPGKAEPERIVRYSVGLEFGQHSEFWKFLVPDGPGKRPGVKYRVTIFETDLPPQRNWAPRKSGYFRVLWEREFAPMLN